ncbi:MAG: signal peptidase II [Acidobacteriota bacterium]|nr:signal peptidase II [Acidobacteriota bacterium]
MTPKTRLFLGAFAVSLILDQLTKRWIIATLDFTDRIEVIDGFFYLTHVRNPGAAFSLFATAPAEIREPFFIVVTLIAIGLIVSFLRKLSPGEKLSAFALGLILGGAVGNLIDRIEHRVVVDFRHIRLWSGYSWPDFNLADSFIVVASRCSSSSSS